MRKAQRKEKNLVR